MCVCVSVCVSYTLELSATWACLSVKLLLPHARALGQRRDRQRERQEQQEQNLLEAAGAAGTERAAA